MAKTTQNDLTGLLLSVYRAARELPLDEFHNSALELIRPWLKFDSSMWASGSVGEKGIEAHHVTPFREPPEKLQVNNKASLIAQLRLDWLSRFGPAEERTIRTLQAVVSMLAAGTLQRLTC